MKINGHKTMKKIMKKHMAMMVCALLLTACGFQLQGMGQQTLLPQTAWAVHGDAMQDALTRALQRQGAQVDAQAATSIKILSIKKQRDIDYINISGTTDAYLLTLTVQAQAYRNANPWGAEMTVQVKRRLDYRDSEIHAKQDEEAWLWARMQDDAAEQLVRRLGYLKTAP